MRHSYHRWPNRAAYLDAAFVAGWQLDDRHLPAMPGMASAGGLAGNDDGDQPDASWHLIVATDLALPASIAAAEQPATEAPMWFSGVPREPAAPPAPFVPDDVSFWQFMLAASMAGFVTQAEALVAVRDRAMPAAFAAALSGLPAEAQAVATLKFSGITRMVRADPLFGLLVQAGIATDEQIDAVFVAAAGIT
jgi:hypothetical protein